MTADTIADDRVITIDFGKSLEQLIAEGSYDWVNPLITRGRFPIGGVGIEKFRTKLFHFDRYISSEDAVAAVKSEGFEPATHVHGLAFGATFPDEQRKYLIACLGFSARVLFRRRVVCIDGSVAIRHLDLGRWDDDWRGYWRGYWRFLAVQEVSAA